MTFAASTRLSRRLQSIFNIQAGEGARVLVMIVYSAAAIGGVLTVGTTVGDTLFLAGQPASAIPYLLILPALFIIPTLLLYNRIAARFRLERVIIGSNAALLGGTVIFRFLLAAPFGQSFAVLAALYLFVEVAYTLVILQFWSLAGLIFNPREAKRLFGLIATGGTFANILAGLSLGALVQLIGVENLLWVMALAVGACLVCAEALGRYTPARAEQAAPEQRRQNFRQDLNAITQSPLLLAIGGLTLLVSLLINVGGYQFSQSLQINFAGRAVELATYLGVFHFIGGLAGFVVQAYLTGRVMNRFGVFAALAFLPLGFVLGAGLSLLTGGALWAVTILRIVDPIFRRTIHSTALNILYLPAPAGLRERAKELFEGLYAAAFGIAGFGILFLQNAPGWNYLYYSIPVLGLAGLWLALLPWTRRQYTAALAASLKRRVLDLENTPINVSDETTVRVLRTALRDPDELRLLHALQLIASAPAVNWDAHVIPLLQHPSAAVRMQALQSLGRQGNLRHAGAVFALFDDAETDVQAAALPAFCTMMGPAASPRVTPRLADPAPRVKGAAVVGLLRYGDPDGVQHATAELNRMVTDDAPALRQEGARAIGLIQSLAFGVWLIPLFDDANAGVQLNAIRAAGALNSRALLPHLIRKLGDKIAASAAVEAIARYRDAIEPDLAVALNDPRVAAHLPRILSARRTPAAVDTLRAHFQSADDTVRGEVYRALNRLQAEGVPLALSKPQVREALLHELRGGYAWVSLREDLGQDGLDALLADALRVRLNRVLERVFDLLSLLYPAQTCRIRSVRQTIEATGSAKRALAVELLDTLAERQVKDILIPLIEAPAERVLAIADQRFGLPRHSLSDRLNELAHSTDLWLRACAIFRIGVLKRAELAAPVRAALDSPDPLVRETALVSARMLGG